MAGNPTLASLGRTVLRSYRQVVSPFTWKFFGHLTLDVPIGLATFTMVVTLVTISVSLVVVVPAALVLGWATMFIGRGIGRFERYRYAVDLGVDIAAPYRPAPDGNWWRRFRTQVTSASTWGELAHAVLLFPIGLAGFSVALATWTVPLTLISLPATIWLQPGHLLWIWPGHALHGWAAAGPGLVLGLALLPLAPVVVRALVSVDAAVARVLLGPSRRQALDARVTQLTDTRSRVVDATEAERRRIERDLHDGAQQRLVALAMNLGRAVDKFDSDPTAARVLVDDAHREAKHALVELRDLARGIHPVVLTDRGLDAALSSVAARSPVPVYLNVDVPDRPSPTIEGIAYFVVCEALTNVAKHAGARRASITVARRGERLFVEVTDDGHGGADPGLGSGLTGLRDRIEGVDGWLHISSPVGGPTTLLAEFPCGS